MKHFVIDGWMLQYMIKRSTMMCLAYWGKKTRKKPKQLGVWSPLRTNEKLLQAITFQETPVLHKKDAKLMLRLLNKYSNSRITTFSHTALEISVFALQCPFTRPVGKAEYINIKCVHIFQISTPQLWLCGKAHFYLF